MTKKAIKNRPPVAGGKYENDYLGAFKAENGKIIECTGYFNQIVMAKAFGIELK